MPDEIVITTEEETPPPVEIEIEVEASEPSHDVEFAERITRLEMSLNDKADRVEMNDVYNRLNSVEQLATVNAAVTEVVAEAVEEIITEEATETVVEPASEPASESESDDAPKSKRHRFWGN